MISSILDNYTEVKDGESPNYTSDSMPPPNQTSISPLSQSYGSMLDSDTVDGFDAVTAYVCGPNKLVATTSDGKLPTSILPTSSDPGTINTVIVPALIIGTLAYLKANPPSPYSLGIATDVGNAGALYMYFPNALVGDSGWVLVSGS